MKERVKQLVRYHFWKHWYEKYEMVLMPGSFLVGVTLDFWTFRALQLSFAFLILAVYLVVVAVTIVLLNTDSQRKFFLYARLICAFLLQFSFGSLLSASFIFYWFSGAFSVSWPLLSLFALLMMFNEAFRHYCLKPVVQMSVYFFVLFSILSLVLPWFFNSLDAWVFVLSGTVSLIFILLFVLLVFHFSPIIKRTQKSIFISVLAIFGLMNGLYFLNLIPPIPLSLRDAQVAHSIVRSANGYVLQVEKENWFNTFLPGQTIHLESGKPVYIYSAIFAPTDLRTNIFHQWQFFDEPSHRWIDKERISFPIKGGRSEGYRGYSLKTVVAPGKWRVSIQTQRGQTVGRVGFVVEEVKKRSELVEVVK